MPEETPLLLQGWELRYEAELALYGKQLQSANAVILDAQHEIERLEAELAHVRAQQEALRYALEGFYDGECHCSECRAIIRAADGYEVDSPTRRKMLAAFHLQEEER